MRFPQLCILRIMRVTETYHVTITYYTLNRFRLTHAASLAILLPDAILQTRPITTNGIRWLTVCIHIVMPIQSHIHIHQ